MKRRNLIKLLLALSGMAPALGLGLPRPQKQAFSPRRCALKTHILESPVAGFQYYAGKKLWPKLQLDDELALIREPGNPHDNRAIALFWNGYKIGYIPRRDNAAVAQMLDRQVPLQANITNLKESDDPLERVSVNIELLQI